MTVITEKINKITFFQLNSSLKHHASSKASLELRIDEIICSVAGGAGSSPEFDDARSEKCWPTKPYNGQTNSEQALTLRDLNFGRADVHQLDRSLDYVRKVHTLYR